MAMGAPSSVCIGGNGSHGSGEPGWEDVVVQRPTELVWVGAVPAKALSAAKEAYQRTNTTVENKVNLPVLA